MAQEEGVLAATQAAPRAVRYPYTSGIFGGNSNIFTQVRKL